MDKISKPMENSIDFFASLATQVDRDAQMQFRNEGAAGGPRKIPNELAWKPFAASTLQMPSGTFRIRYGTDRKPRGKSFRGKWWASARRYSYNSKLLNASGMFRKTFKVGTVRKNMMLYGTNHRLAGLIGARPLRQVLFVTDEDINRYAKKFAQFIRDGIAK